MIPNSDDLFASRHVGPDPREIAAMCQVVGVDDIETLLRQTVPASVRISEPLDLPPPLSEPAAIRRLAEIASQNKVVRSLIGMGYNDTILPPVIQRNVLESPAWYTAYTPYQAEISQGRLEALLNFQTMVIELTGMDVANASLLDEGTAAAEAMAMTVRSTKGRRFLVSSNCHPQTINVVATRAEPIGVGVDVVDLAEADLSDCCGVLIQYPDTRGGIVDWSEVVAAVHAAGGLVVVAADPMALVMLSAPGEWGADIVVGSSQRFGVPLGYGGPHAAYIACREKLVRTLPGRLAGVSHDAAGRPALRLALQTREQHIRRERATSNVCTAQVLLAVIAGMYACWHGPDGLSRIAGRIHDLTNRLAAGLRAAGLEVGDNQWFDTLTVAGDADSLIDKALGAGFNVRRLDDASVAIALDERSDEQELEQLLVALGGKGLPASAESPMRSDSRRNGPPLSHPVFDLYHTEHEMLRYLRRLSDKDLALDRTMIPLGSCTMKLNAATEMIPITWDNFSRIHPYAPADQAAGYRVLIEELERWLVEITGYDAVSVQPNAGSQGELAGLLAIRAYHLSRGEAGRTVCLIPSSAHGTNAASAVMAGMEVVVVECDDRGNVSVDDLKQKLETHGPRLSALMVTYPSTHGVFEDAITEICDLVHASGGQVYVDGANLNAMVGIAKPGLFGADVSHLNLHKTFTIPHGGGGPGVGPIGVKAHLAAFLPGDPLSGLGAVAAAPYGSAGILPIPWAYIALMGPEGLTTASKVAILSANYIAERLDEAFPVLYRGTNGRVAHECIVDIRPLTKTTGVTAEDVAKRLADYGFHAPTLSFPVAGTLMIEPTESESLVEIDRFCEAMLSIRSEIDRVASGEWKVEESPLRHAPHTAADVISSDWDRPYSRERAVYPLASLKNRGYFPPVGRIDGVAGDRNLVCSCPPLESYTQ